MKNDDKCKQWVHFWGKLLVGTEWQTELWKKNMFLFICETEWTKKKSFESRFHLKCIFCTLWDSPHLFIAGFENNRHKRIRIPPWLKRVSFYLLPFYLRISCFQHFLEHRHTKPCVDWLLMRPCTFSSLSLSLVLFKLYFVDDVASVCWLQCWALILLELCPYPVL